LPFAAILIILGYSLWKGLEIEYEKDELREKAVEKESYQDIVKNLLKQEKNGL